MNGRRWGPSGSEMGKRTRRERYSSRKQADWTEMPSGLIVPADYARKGSRPIGVDLFAGAGGFSLGFIQAGFHVIAGLDNDPICAITYMTNLGAYPCQFHYATADDEPRLEKAMRKWLYKDDGQNKVAVAKVSGSAWISHYPDIPGVRHFFFGDVRNFNGREMLEAMGLEAGDVDCVMGGPPCQGFSTQGRRNVMDPRNSLVFEFARLALELDPKTIIFENVPGILSMVTPAGVAVIDAFCRVLRDGGFGTLNALKRSLLATSGTGAILKGVPMATKEREQDSDVPRQLSLVQAPASETERRGA